MRRTGSALISVIIIMTLTFLLTAITVDRSLKSQRRTKEAFDDARAYYFAESLIYDMAGYIDKSMAGDISRNQNVVVKGTSASKTSKPSGMTIIDDSRVSSYNVRLASDIVKTYEDSSTIELTYNIESKVVYNSRKYTVIVQMVTEYTKGIPNTFLGHRISSKRAYRL